MFENKCVNLNLAFTLHPELLSDLRIQLHCGITEIMPFNLIQVIKQNDECIYKDYRIYIYDLLSFSQFTRLVL